MSRIKYRIYPSLIDKFQAFLDSDIESESFMNVDRETGEQRFTADEIASRHERELVDAINRVPREPIEAADKGTCFNEIVDCLIAGKGTERDDMKIESVLDMFLVCDRFCREKNCDYQWDECRDECLSAYSRAREGKCDVGAIKASMNGFDFLFDYSLCRAAADYFGPDAVPQHMCRATIDTRYGDVELYGYADEIVRDKVYDIKTTSAYVFGKFERGWQKEVYPYCLMKSGEIGRVSEFEYTVFQLTRPLTRKKVIGGKMYREVYTYDFDKSEKRLRAILERFVEWLEYRREMITDKKIFGESCI